MVPIRVIEIKRQLDYHVKVLQKVTYFLHESIIVDVSLGPVKHLYQSICQLEAEL